MECQKTLAATLAGVVFAPFLPGCESGGKDTAQPNIIWIMAEDMGRDLECYGMPAVKTPVLNRMAEEGILYTNACCSNPISSPSRSAMMTGVHQNTINAHNHRSNRGAPLPEGIYPITYHLRNAGYTCILGNGNVMDKGRKTDCNFKHTGTGVWDGRENFGLFDKYDEFTPEDQPFFAQIQLNVTHRGDWWKEVTARSEHPVDPDEAVLPPYLADHPKIRAEWASYLDQIEYMDNEVGLILCELEEKGLLDNTVIFFIADNGRCEIKGKGYLYEPGVKIPMIVWGRGVSPAVVDDIVSTLDISATILDLAGVALPDYLSGKPLLDKGRPTAGHDYFYASRDDWDEISDCSRAIATQRWKYIRNYMPEYGWERRQVYLDFYRPAVHVMRNLKNEGRLNEHQARFFADSRPAEELYDLLRDPDELYNLAGEQAYGETLAEMRAKMCEWQSEHCDAGLVDKDSRHTPAADGLRDWVMARYPDEWKKLTEGEICDGYQKWNSEYKEFRKNNRNK